MARSGKRREGVLQSHRMAILPFRLSRSIQLRAFEFGQQSPISFYQRPDLIYELVFPLVFRGLAKILKTF